MRRNSARLAAPQRPTYKARQTKAPGTMLEKLRDASKTWVATILIGMLVVSFAIFGINDIFSRSRSISTANSSAAPRARPRRKAVR